MFVILGAVLAGALVVGVVAAVGFVVHIWDNTRDWNQRKPNLVGGSSQVYAADGQRLGFVNSDLLHSPIQWSAIPADLRNATVAIEDQRFYQNNGVDLTGIFRAAVRDVLHGKALQGGSTITMQLMRNLYMTGDKRTLKQKIEEAKLAIDYEKTHSKRSILTSYLNSIPYGTVGGQTAIGVQAASRTFFGNKPAAELDLQQAALLAGLPQAPSEYNPFLHPQAARERRNEVLGKMAQLHYITQAQAGAAERAGLEVSHGDFYTHKSERFFFEYVREALVHRYGKKVVEEGGLKVYTTLDLQMQHQAREAIAEILNEPGDPAAAVVTVDPHTGDIQAMAESKSFDESQFNLAADGHRQPGSTFKAIDLADALSRGVDPNSTFYDSHTLEPGWLAAEPNYRVKTFGGEQNGVIDLVSATLKSDNTVYAQLAADLGEETVTQMAYKMGVKTHLSSYPAEALGGLTLGVTPLEMAEVYATLADGGLRNEPIAIKKVVFPDGRVDTSWGTPHRERVLSEPVTGEETAILHQNVLGGTAVRSAIGCPTAAKTGTTSELYDAWLDGYNSQYSTVVWMGYPKRNISMTDVHGEPQQGGYLPAEIWHAYMTRVTEGETCAALNESSAGIEYKPFYGKYAATGLALAAKEAESEGKQHKHGKRSHGPAGKVPLHIEESPPEPPENEHAIEQTGGAAPK